MFEKRYDELCQILNIRRWAYFSKIKEKLGPSLDELTKFGYLADWRIEHTSDNQGYKILLFHGEKFHRDRRQRLARKRTSGPWPEQGSAANDRSRQHYQYDPQSPSLPSQPTAAQVFDPALVAEFTRRGINEKKAHELLANLKPGQDVVPQLEHAEYIVRHSQIPITNPAGFIIRLIQYNTPVPDGFETNAKRKAREDRERRERDQRAAQEAQQELDWSMKPTARQKSTGTSLPIPRLSKRSRTQSGTKIARNTGLQPRAWQSCPPGLKSKNIYPP